MKSLSHLNDYLKYQQTPPDSDTITKELIKEYYENIALKSKWGNVLKTEHQFALDANKKTAPPLVSRSNKKQFIIVAVICSVIACLLAGTMIWLPNKNVTENKLQALLNDQYANPVPRELMKGSENMAAVISQAYMYYQDKEYAQSIPLLEEVIATNPVDEEHHFYLALSYLYNDQAGMAINEFDWILNQDKSTRRDAATWYLALSLTDAEEYERAREYLTEVSEWRGNSGKLKMANEAKILLKHIQNLSKY